MASHRQVEAPITPDERAPLLAHQEARTDAQPASGEEDVAVLEPEKAAARTWHYVWRGFWILFALFVIAVFVKGWIEADDVNVSLRRPLQTSIEI
jgi:hypothetical protein